MFYGNGFIRSEILKEGDSVNSKYFYNYYDSGFLDSLYKFKQFGDTLLPFQQYIYNNEAVDDELAVKTIKSDSGAFIQFNLLKPKGEWISVYFRNYNYKNDSLIEGEPKPLTSMTIKNPGDSVIIGFAYDKGIYLKTDTVGSIGHFFIRYLKFKIKNNNEQSYP